ncbi:MAG: signal peptidase I [Rhodobacterales bacterium]|nr:MAG: signal peptidase I [Rhodobacterales bacterium]
MAKNTDKPDGIWEMIKTVFWALLIAGIFRTLFFQPFWIPSGSMKDTLLIGDFLFVNKMAYGYSKYSCPFAACPISGRVGMPGDKIQMKNGVLHINGQPVKLEDAGIFTETYAKQGWAGNQPKCKNNPGFGGICEKTRMKETLPNGVSHSILDIGNHLTDNTGIYTVPEGHYFLMGDNRDNSSDSRVSQNRQGVGYVPFENFIGRADRVMFSSAGKSLFFFWTWRSDRYFKAIQ